MSDFRYLYRECRLCGRECSVDRTLGERGVCASGDVPAVARVALHHWEEPPISGWGGSGTVFFSGCSLGCVYCQNRSISTSAVGEYMDSKRLADEMLSLERQGAHNINFVTPTHFIPHVIESVTLARDMGLKIPIVYNTGGYDSPSALKLLSGIVDIYLTDFKYIQAKTSASLSQAENYPDVAKHAFLEMHRQQPTPIFDGDIMKKGVIARVLLLPGHVAMAKLTLKYLYETYGDSIYISLMSQYTPSFYKGEDRNLKRKVTKFEYDKVLDLVQELDLEGFCQDRQSATSDYTPDF